MIRTRDIDTTGTITTAELAELRLHQARYILDWITEMANGSFSRTSSFVEFEKRVKDGLSCLGFAAVIVNVTATLTAPGMLNKARVMASLQEDYGDPFESIVDYFDLT